MITIQIADMPAYRLHSFDDVAAEIGCGPGDLRSAIHDVRARQAADAPLQGGFRAVAVADVERVARERDKRVVLPEALAGFGALCRYDDAVKALGIPGHAFEEEMRRAKVPIVPVAAMTDAGRDYALKKLKHLAARKVPAGLSGDEVREWREAQRRKREMAEDAASARGERPRPHLNRRRRSRPVEDEGAREATE